MKTLTKVKETEVKGNAAERRKIERKRGKAVLWAVIQFSARRTLSKLRSYQRTERKIQSSIRRN